METELLAREDLREKLELGLDGLPPFSPILTKLLAGLADEDVSVAKLADCIEKDTVIAGRVLRHVNSSLYGCAREVSSVRHAVAIMGLNKLRNLALSMSVCRMWDQVRMPRGWSAARFNLHSVGAAVLSDLLAQYLPVGYSEGAFTAGLLHDIGKMLIATSLPEVFLQIEEKVQFDDIPPEEAEHLLLGVSHASLSAIVLGKWNLPSPIREAVANHHSPQHSPLLPADREWSLGQVVRLADQVTNGIGASVVAPRDGAPPATAQEALASAGLADLARQIAESFEQDFDGLRACF